MKKFIISLLLLTPLLTGCTNIDTQLTINDDKSASVVTSLTYEGNLANQGDAVANMVQANYKSFLDPLYKIETAYNTKLSTITASKGIKNLMHNDLDLSSLGFTSNLPSGRFIEVKKNFLVTSYNIDATYDLEKQVSGIQKTQKAIVSAKSKGLQPEYLQKYGDPENIETPSAEAREDFIEHLDEDTKQFTENAINNEENQTQQSENNDLYISFSIKVPSFASFNNADNVNLNVYTWNISTNEPAIIKLQYIKYSGLAIAFIILAGIACLILLARRIVKRESQKRIDE